MQYVKPAISDFGSIADHTFGVVNGAMRGLGFGQWSGGTHAPSSEGRGASSD